MERDGEEGCCWVKPVAGFKQLSSSDSWIVSASLPSNLEFLTIIVNYS